MDFIVGLPQTSDDHYTIYVSNDYLTKYAHILPIKVSYYVERLAKLCVSKIVAMHEILKNITKDQEDPFTSRFWKSVQTAKGSKLKFNTAFHLQIDGQYERIIQTLEDMLRACVMDFKGNWGKKLRLIEFLYNNSYHVLIGMTPFEALYRRKNKSLIHWDKLEEKHLETTDFI